jgi:hypothetical protein
MGVSFLHEEPAGNGAEGEAFLASIVESVNREESAVLPSFREERRGVSVERRGQDDSRIRPLEPDRTNATPDAKTTVPLSFLMRRTARQGIEGSKAADSSAPWRNEFDARRPP